MPILLPPFTLFGVAVRGKSTLEMLELVIPYSENPNEGYAIVF